MRLRSVICLLGVIATATATAPASGAALRPIKKSDLSAAVEAITIASIRRTQKTLSPSNFNAKMRNALKSPQHLKQTFPGLLGMMLKDLVGTKALPGKIGPIGFDDHVENTGTVRIGKGRTGSIQTLIDVDDSGVGPAGVEAVSIGTGLTQAGFKPRVMKKVFKAFPEEATGRERGPIAVAGPKWGKLRRDWLQKNTKTEKRDGKKLLSFKHVVRAPLAEYDAVARAAQRSPVLKNYDVLDIAQHVKTVGGSQGLVEYQLLARDRVSDHVRVFLLKEATPPGANQLGLKQPAEASRLAVLEKSLWKTVPKDVFFYVRDVKLAKMDKPMDFLVRDKFSMVGNVAKGPNDEETAIKVARLYGREHAGQFGDISAADLAKWMKKSTRSVSGAFVDLRDQLHAEFRAGTPSSK